MQIWSDLLCGLAIAFCAPAPDIVEEAPSSVPAAREYQIISSETVRQRLEAKLADRSLRARPSEISALGFAMCFSAWRDNVDEGAACVQSQMPRESPSGLVLFYAPWPQHSDRLAISCIGPARRLEVVIGAAAAPSDFSVLSACLELALEQRSAADFAIHGIRSAALLPSEAERLEGSESEASVLSVAIDHVGFPRGVRGQCLVTGRINAVRRGPLRSPLGLVELSIPCSAEDSREEGRRIPMGELSRGSFAEIYIDNRQRLLDYRRLMR